MEDAGAEVSDEGLLDEAFPEMGQKIGGNQVGADGRKRPSPALPAPDADLVPARRRPALPAP